MTTVSFIVPTKNAERTIAACVRSLRGQHLEPGVCDRVEVVLVDNHSTDRTVELATPYVDHVEIAGPERCAQRNLGAARSAGDVVVFVDADMVLEPTIAVESARAIAHGDLDLLVLPELAFGESFFAECRSLEKRLYLGDASVEAGRAIRHTLFDTVGGWDETLTAGEDWDLGVRLRLSPQLGLSLFAIALPVALFAPAFEMCLALFARSIKEAQSYLAFAVMLPIVPVMMTSMSDAEAAPWLEMIPIVGQSQSIIHMLIGEAVSLPYAITCAALTLALAALCVFVLARLLEREAIVFGRS